MSELADRVEAILAGDDAERDRRYPGLPPGRQPVHTVYVPADRFTATTVRDWGAAAERALDAHGPLDGFDEAPVRAKLAREPIEDLRIDFEDGYGIRPDVDEDAHARAAAAALAAAPPAFSGIRIKSLEAPTRRRALRTLELFLETPPPQGFRLTLPKVTSIAQIEAIKAIAEHHDVRYEIQIETPQAVLAMTDLVRAAGSRCLGLHFGTYDYTAGLGISAANQSLDHPAADHAKAVMQVAAAQTGLIISDGSTNVLPVGDTGAVRAAWTLHAGLVRRALERGIYQGWDLHPAQLPTRFAATYAFFRDGVPAATARLRAYLDRAEDRASTGIADEPATARALSGFLLRALDCGAVAGIDGFTAAELRAVSDP
ncbi:MAG TPA: aldolase/citrate lyase family protein [Jatrophihabitantaceae bacterium]